MKNAQFLKHQYAIAILVMFLLFAIIIYQQIYTRSSNKHSLTVTTSQSSFFELDNKGRVKLNDMGLPFQSENEIVRSNVKISPSNTAFFVIDPWVDMPSDFLNEYFGKVTKNYIIPLIEKASTADFPIYIFTNDCKTIVPSAYSCKIPDQFYTMSKHYPKLQIVYWQDLNQDKFVESLKAKGISKLIYTGFASNICILGRPTGMINMVQKGFSLYFIPEASAAAEVKDTWQSQKIHENTTLIISQWMAKIINYDDIYSKFSV